MNIRVIAPNAFVDPIIKSADEVPPGVALRGALDARYRLSHPDCVDSRNLRVALRFDPRRPDTLWLRTPPKVAKQMSRQGFPAGVYGSVQLNLSREELAARLAAEGELTFTGNSPWEQITLPARKVQEFLEAVEASSPSSAPYDVA